MNTHAINHLAIRGTSFCGSTIVSYLLGCLPGCANIGESHWITSQRSFKCLRCKDECSIINDDLRTKLSSTSLGWYEILRNALKANILISSDKDPEILEKYDPERFRCELILFKNPGENLISYSKVLSTPPIDCYEDYLSNWIRIYTYRYSDQPPPYKYIYLNDLLQQPARFINRIADEFCISGKISDNDIQLWREHPHHSLGGNFDPWDVNCYHKIAIKPPKPFQEGSLPVDVTTSIAYQEALSVYHDMLSSQNRIKF